MMNSSIEWLVSHIPPHIKEAIEDKIKVAKEIHHYEIKDSHCAGKLNVDVEDYYNRNYNSK
jgi:hypothetical protein